MKDKIKEILDKLFVYKNENDEMKYQPEDILTIDDVWLLLDYITNLKEENERLKELCNKYEEEHKTTFKIWKKDLKNFEHEKNRELKSRIEKAIKFIKENTERALVNGNNEELIDQEDIPILLNILQGSDKE